MCVCVCVVCVYVSNIYLDIYVCVVWRDNGGTKFTISYYPRYGGVMGCGSAGATGLGCYQPLFVVSQQS